ncbi:DNA-binding response regulator [Enterobacterales bacterium CwR94]|nr:DNA-binding response regulator [Enterobacterales bacterium CwR94]
MIEDDLRLARMIAPYLEQHGLQVTHAASAEAAYSALALQSYAVILLDLMLNDADGLDVCRYIRSTCHDDPAIIMVTGRGEPTDRIVGLELGADDYIPKPFEPRELLARIRAILRRLINVSAAAPTEVLRFGELEIDASARTVTLNQRTCNLTSLQFDLLLALARNAGRVLNREQLWQTVRGQAYESFDRAIDVHIGRIRQEIEDDPRAPKRIITVRGVGYVLSRVAQST